MKPYDHIGFCDMRPETFARVLTTRNDTEYLIFRMRNATIVMVNLRGIAAETIKNIVLAGIGKLIIIDPSTVSEEDLGAGFLFREKDVGKLVRTLCLFGGC